MPKAQGPITDVYKLHFFENPAKEEPLHFLYPFGRFLSCAAQYAGLRAGTRVQP
jgi:hypothetical protein